MIHRLEVDSVQLSFGMRSILSDVYLKCETGKVTGLLGRNGTGKTCLMNIIYGSLIAENQSVRVDGSYLRQPFKHPELIAFLPQFNFLPASFRISRIFSDFNLSFSEFSILFPELEQMKDYKVRHLSGGTSRLIQVYIILKSKARFAILDEPFSHIMPLHLVTLKELIKQEKCNKGILVSDHLYIHIVDIADALYLVKDGKTHLTKDKSDLIALGYIRAER